jgi:hypothetical protein
MEVSGQFYDPSILPPRDRAPGTLCFWIPSYEGVLGEWRYSSTHSLTSTLDGGEWLTSRPGRLTPRERAPATHRIGGWVGPRAVLDAVVKRKILSPRRESNPRTPIVQPTACRYTDWAITALQYLWCVFSKFEHPSAPGTHWIKLRDTEFRIGKYLPPSGLGPFIFLYPS